MEITKEQIKQAYESPEKLKEFFPEAFEVEIKVGNWYKNSSTNTLFCVTSEDEEGHLYGYGFQSENWFCYVNEKEKYLACHSFFRIHLKEATREEVEEVLIKEANKRGFKNGVKYLSPGGDYKRKINVPFYLSENGIHSILCCKNGDWIFEHGIWAEIIPDTLEVTLDQVAEKFGVDKIKIIK